MSTQAKLDKILQTKNEIKAAIIAKGVDVSESDTFSSYPSKIASIEGGGGFLGDEFLSFYGNDISYLFYKRTVQKDVLDFIKDNIKNFIYFDYLFYNNFFKMTLLGDNVTFDDLLSIDLTDAQTTNSTFYGMKDIDAYENKIAIEGQKIINIPNSTNVNSMFSNSTLKNIKLISPKATLFNSTFSGCSFLDTVEADFSSATQLSSTFSGCSELTKVDFSTTTNKLTSFSNSVVNNCTKMKELLNLNITNISTQLNFSSNNFKRVTFQNTEEKLKSSNIVLTNSTDMTVEDAVETLTSLPALTSGIKSSIKFNTDVSSSLTDEQKEIGTSKGWTVL